MATAGQPRLIRPLGLGLGVFVLAAMLVLIAHNTVGFGAPRFSYFIEEPVYDFVTLAAALVTLGRAALRKEQRLAWTLLGLGLLSWAAGDLYWTVVLRGTADPPFPSPDDVLYLSGYALVLAGIVAKVRSRVGQMTAVIWIDVAMGALCVAAIGSSLLMGYVLAHTSGTPLETGVAVSYPALDLVIIAMAAGGIALTGWRPGRALALIGAGVACGAVGDAVYTYQSLAGTYTAASWNNFLWPLATVLIAAAALQPQPAHPELDPPEGLRAFTSPAVFALAALALVVLERGDLNEPVVAALAIATLAALIARVVLTIADNHRLVRELETDPLTGLFNRGRLIHDLDHLYARDDGGSHLLAILDLDGFKAYNDAFGHPAGDTMLIRLARQLAAAVGERGRAYRMGGDEFAMLIPDGSRTAVAEGAVALSECGEGFAVSCSRGAVEIPSEARDRARALQLADQRMYADKDSRRGPLGGEVEAVLIRILNQRSQELAEHVDAVKDRAIAVGKELGLPPGELAALGQASELHDIGKIAIPDAILKKAGPLDDDEWRFMRQHTIMGERIVSAAPSLAPVASLIRSSHERWDGTGYPDGLTGEEIPLAARIMFACDAYDAITTERAYSPARTPEAALAELFECAGTQFDPGVIGALERVVRSARGDQERLHRPAERPPLVEEARIGHADAGPLRKRQRVEADPLARRQAVNGNGKVDVDEHELVPVERRADPVAGVRGGEQPLERSR